MKKVDFGSRWLALIAMTSGLAMIFLDSTILPVALPTIQKALSISEKNIAWAVNIYFLCNASLVIAGGRISDILGHRKIFCFGLALFALASATGGLSYNTATLLTSRAVQGIGAAFLAPSALAILFEVFPVQERGRAIGISVSLSSIFLSLGPFIGGFLTELFSWRWIFLVNLPIAVIGILVTLFAVPKSKRVREGFDVIGALWMITALVAIIAALMELKRAEGKMLFVLCLLVVSAISFYALYRHCNRKEEPFFDFTLFRSKNFLSGTIIVLCAQFLLMNTVFWPIFFQHTLGLSPLQAGSYTIISTLPVMVISPISGYMSDKIGPKIPVCTGFICLLFSLLSLSLFSYFEQAIFLFCGVITFGIGIAFIMTPTGTATLSYAPKRKRGLANGIYNTIRFMGASLGIAIIGSSNTWIYSRAFLKSYQENQDLRAYNTDKLRDVFYNISDHAGDITPKIREYLHCHFMNASFKAFFADNIISMVIALFGLLLTFFYLKAYKDHQVTEV